MHGRPSGLPYAWGKSFNNNGLVDAGAPATRPGIAFVVRRRTWQNADGPAAGAAGASGAGGCRGRVDSIAPQSGFPAWTTMDDARMISRKRASVVAQSTRSTR